MRSLIEDDSRYRAVPSSSLREQWFGEYIDEVKKNMDPEEVKEAEKKKRIEESMRARQQAVAEEREENNRVITEQRLQHRREESVQRFKALLVDIVSRSHRNHYSTPLCIGLQSRLTLVYPLVLLNPFETRQNPMRLF